MGSVTYDWSPVFSAVQGLGQQYAYRNLLNSMFGQGQQPAATPQGPPPPAQHQVGTPSMGVNPGALGGTNMLGMNVPQVQIPGENIPAGPSFDEQPHAPRPGQAMDEHGASPLAGGMFGSDMRSMLPLLQMLGPQAGLPLLLQMKQHQMERQETQQDKAMVPLTPDELKAEGYRPGSVVFKDAFNGRHVVQSSDVKSPEAVNQAVDEHQREQLLTPAALQQKKDIEAATQGPQWAALSEKKREFNLENPMFAGGTGGAAPSLDKMPVATQAMVKAMIEGRQAPPSSFALSKPYWQNMIALANAVDPTFDQTAWGARASARKDMLGGGKSYQALNSGNTVIQHLGRLYDQVGDVAGNQIPLVGNLVNSGENALAQASGKPGVNAYNDTLGHLAEETTKFYRNSGGAESDVQRNMGNLADNLSTSQKQAGVANTVHLVYGKLAPMVEQYNKTMGTNYPTSHFLSSEAVNTIKRMGYDPDTGEKSQTSGSGGGWSIKLKGQ